MSSFVACAKTTAFTIFYTFVSFQVFAWIWFLIVDEYTRAAAYGMLWLNQLTTAFIGIAAGLLAARYERRHPVFIAVVAAVLVELLHASASGAFLADAPLRTLTVAAICAALAAGVAWLRLRLVPPPVQEEAQ